MSVLLDLLKDPFIKYDWILLGLFIILLGIFLFRKRKEVKRDGLLLLHKTKWGINLIHHTGEKYKRTLRFLSYVSVSLGYLLMAGMIYLAGRLAWIYAFQGAVVRAIKIPPIMPLIPYIDKIAPNLNLPTFYFTYWIIIIAIIAITHEFAHGIFAARNKIRIKSTGFGFFPFFLPVFLAAFVELDEKRMAKKKIFDQIAVLSAGTFANVLTAILFSIVMLIFFSAAFAPSGVVFDSYPYTSVAISSITMANNATLINPSYQELLNSLNETGLNKIEAGSGKYLATKNFIEMQNSTGWLILYYDAPAIKANLESTILKINGIQVTSVNGLADELYKNPPGTKITLTVMGMDNAPYNRDIVLGSNPRNSNQSWLGIGFYPTEKTGTLAQLYNNLFSLNRNHVYYSSRIGDAGVFVYHLLWWLVIISISVALINMLPMGMFDGGKFFYLTILAITKKESIAKRAYKFATYFFLFLLAVVMFFWVFYIR